MCFAVNQENKKALIGQLELWTKADLTKLGWDPQRWTNAFSHPSLPIILRDDPGVVMAAWGLVPLWVKNQDQAAELRKRTLNAKSETMFELPSFRGSAAKQRCLIPVNGFFEYQHRDGGKIKQPYFIHLPDGQVMLLGGLWSEWQGSRSFTICTMPANALMAQIHNSKQRMPVIIQPEFAADWLAAGGADDIRHLLLPRDDLPLQAEETSRDSNSKE